MKSILSYEESSGKFGLHRTLSKRKGTGVRAVKGRNDTLTLKRIIKTHEWWWARGRQRPVEL